MKLADFYAKVGPYLLGESDHKKTVRALYGPRSAAHQVDAERLRIYGEFCTQHRLNSLGRNFLNCRAVLVQQHGEPAWEALVARYFRAHPMHHFELNRNGVHFPEFLAAQPAGGELPAFLPELADFEWWEWQVYTAPDEPQDRLADEGALRLGSTVEMRPYHYDFTAWLDEHSEATRPPAPEAAERVVLFWRDRALAPRRARAYPLEMFVIKAVLESVPLDAALARRLGVASQELRDTCDDLHKAGILLGKLRKTAARRSRQAAG